MAEVPVFHAGFQLGDSNKGSLGSGSFQVSEANAKLYIAAADTAARAATAVGLLLAAALATTRAAGQTYKRKFYVQCDYVDNAFAPPTKDDGIYNSNKWKVTFRTTNNGLPAIDTIYLPQYLIAGVVMDADGIAADLADPPVSAFITQFLATALSKYGTAINSVISIQRNDS